MENNNSKKDKFKAFALLAATKGLEYGKLFAAKELYSSFFKRYEKKPLYKIYGEFDYSRVKDRLKRKLFSFNTDTAELQGYFYPCENCKGMVIVCHGMHAGADDYLPFIMYFVKNGYSVFTYDCKGTYLSSGDSTVGMGTPLVDLDYAIRFIKSSREFSKYPLFIFGHSWGGYAACSVLSIHKNVKAVAAIAPFNDAYTLIEDKGVQFTGPFADSLITGFPKDFLETYQKHLFKDYTKYTAAKGINSTDIPVLIAHGNRDFTISFSGQSVISHKKEIRRNNVYYLVTSNEQAGHETILHSLEAIKYQKKIKKLFDDLKDKNEDDLTEKQLTAFCNKINHALYSEVNEELMSKVVKLFDSTL